MSRPTNLDNSADSTSMDGDVPDLERMFVDATKAHGRGELDRAENLYRQVLARVAEHPGALLHLGLVARQQGHMDEAAEWLARAVEASPGDAHALNNLANLLRTLGRTDEAISTYRSAIAERPDYVDALCNLASLLEERGEKSQAEALYREAIRFAPTDPGAWLGLGAALLAQNKSIEGLECFERAITLRPQDAVSHFNMAGALKLLGRPDDAMTAYRRALGSNPNYTQAHRDLGLLLKSKGRYEEASRHLRRALALAPNDLQVRFHCAELLYEMNHYQQAVKIFEDVVLEIPNNVAAQNGLARTYVKLGRSSAAVESCRKAIAHNPSAESLYCTLAIALLQQGNLPGAREACETAISLNWNNAAAHNCLGLVQMSAGNAQLASESFETAMQIDANFTAPYLNLAHVRRFSVADRPEIERVEARLERHEHSNEDRADLHFALGKIYDDCNSYAKAFQHFQAANRLVRKRTKFKSRDFRNWCSRLHEVFTPELLKRLEGIGDPSERPIFVTGMPRSGTTLVEQVLASHPHVHGAGELTKINEIIDGLETRSRRSGEYPDCILDISNREFSWASRQYLEHISSLNPGARRVTDKMPENFFHLGLIAILLPNARIVHCRRDALDVCFSNYMQMYFQGHNYAYDLDDIATYYLEYERIMNHWLTVLPIEIHEIHYEALVDDQEQTSRDLLASCGLDWDDRCLEFHQTERAINTASDWQVRRPIYKHAARRWKNYEPYLGATKAKLGYVEST